MVLAFTDNDFKTEKQFTEKDFESEVFTDNDFEDKVFTENDFNDKSFTEQDFVSQKPISRKQAIEQDTATGFVHRKSGLALKTMLDIFASPVGGTEGLVKDYPKVADFLFRDKKDEITKITPKTALEHVESAAVQFGSLGPPMKALGSVFGLGRALPLGQKLARAGAAGFIFGAIPKGTPEERLARGGISAAVFPATQLLGLGIAKGATKIANKQLTQRLSQVLPRADAISKAMDITSPSSKATAYNQILKELPSIKDRNFVLNILRQKYNQSPRVYRNWYQKNVGDPIYNKYIRILDKVIPDTIKEKFVYRAGSPEQLTDIIEQRAVNLNNWNELANESRILMTEGVSSAESITMHRALVEPTQYAILKHARPDLGLRVVITRNNIDKVSRELVDELAKKANITDSKILAKQTLDLRDEITDGLGKYVKRLYEPKSEVVRNIFGGKRLKYKEPRIYERAVIARRQYESNLIKKINAAQHKLERLSKVTNLSGVGKVTSGRLLKRGINTVDDIQNVPKQDLAQMLMLEEKNVLDSPTRQLVVGLSKIDDEIVDLNKVLRSHGLSSLAKKEKAIDTTSRAFNKRVKPISSQMSLDNKIHSMIYDLEGKKQVLIKNLSQKGSTRYLKAEVRAEGIIEEARKLAGQRRGLVGKINEYNNLIKKPLKPVDIPYEARKRMNVIETAGYPAFKSVKDTALKLENARMYNEIAIDKRLASTNPAMERYGWTKLPNEDKYGSLRNMFIHPSVEKDVRGMEKIFTEQDRIYNKLLSLWKTGKVVYNPATHGRNIASNTVLLHSSGVPMYRMPDLLSNSYDDIANKSGLYVQLKKSGLGMGTFTRAEVESLKEVYKSKSLLDSLVKAKKDLKPFSKLGNLYELEEEIFKIAKVRHLMEQGFKPANALKEAEKWLFNYNKLPDFIRRVRQSPFGVPFITFQYKAIPRMIEGAIKNPLEVAKYPLLFGSLEQLAVKKFNLSEQDVRAIKRNKPLSYILPFTDKHGQLRVFDLQYILPYGQLAELTGSGKVGLSLGIGSNPIFSTGYSLFWANKDPFTNKEIVNEHSNVYKEFKAATKFLANQLLPPLTPFVGHGANQIGKAIQDIPLTRYGERPDYVLEMIGNLAGLKTYPTTVTTAQIRAIKEISFIKNKADREARSIQSDLRLSEEERIKQIEEVYTDSMRIITEKVNILQEE